MIERAWIFLMALAFALAPAIGLGQANYPNRAVRMIVASL